MKKFKFLRYKLFEVLVLAFISNIAFAAEEVDVVKDTSDYLTKYFIALALAVLPAMVVYQIIQVKTGKKEPMDALAPIGWTSLIVAAPMIVTAIINLITPYLGSWAL